MPEDVIETHSLGRCFGDVIAVDDVTFNVQRGELFGLLGPNGAGKTTLLRILTGQLEPTSGRCSIMGIDPAKEPLSVKKAIGVVPEVESPPSFLTGREYLQFIGLIRGLKDIEKRADHWMHFMGMADVATVPCKDLSKGTRQKLVIAAALIHEPPLLFLDEPFSGLDPHYQRILKEYLTDYLGNGGTVFMCTHILEIAEKMCTRIGIINRGRIVAIGKKSDLARGDESLDAAFMRYTEG
ncbi:MAG: ABC transporter ATP-binding protein [Methanomassiliicoccales archaeon]|nr:ABC transporter ATP-binding protein [Methanomassiliicoccales archaeon]